MFVNLILKYPPSSAASLLFSFVWIPSLFTNFPCIFELTFLICLPRTECSVSCGGGHRSRVRQATLGVRCRRVFKGPEVLPRLRQFSHKQNVHLLPSSSCYLLLVVCCCCSSSSSSSSSCLSLLLSVLTMSLWSLSTEWAVCARCSAQQPMVESRSLNSLKGTWSIKKKSNQKPRTFFRFLSLHRCQDATACVHGAVCSLAHIPCHLSDCHEVMKAELGTKSP